MHESVKRPRKRVRSPLRAWIWATVALLAAVLLGASTLHFVTASCAAELAAAVPVTAAGPPSATASTHGQAFYYNLGGAQGSCSYGSLPAGGLYVSLATPQYAGGASCGSYLDVSGPDGTVQAEVVDQCPGCSGGGMDMSEAAFSRVASPAAGTAQVSYRLIRDPRLPGPIEVRVARSASAGWLALQVLNNGNPLRSVAVAPAGQARWQPLTLDSDDYWAAPAGAGPGPFQVRVADAFGHQVVLPGIRLLPGSVQRTEVLMYQAGRPPFSPPSRSAARPSSPATTGPASKAPSGGHIRAAVSGNESTGSGPHC